MGIPDGWTTGNNRSESSRRSSGANGTSGQMAGSTLSSSSNPWDNPPPATPSREDRGLKKQISFDPSSGAINLPDEEENVWGEEAGEDSGDEREGALESPVSGVEIVMGDELMRIGDVFPPPGEEADDHGY
jgi:hypothetical protein